MNSSVSTQLKVTGGLLTRNWILNVFGQLLPLVIAVAATPYVIRGLGQERFGILSLAWALLSYTAILDLGLSRATTKYAAEHLARGELDRLSSVVRSSLYAQLVLGSIGAVAAFSLAPLLANHVLKISLAMRSEALDTFLILALSLPVILVGNVYRGLLEAGQQFASINIVRVPTNISIFLIPAAAVPLRIHLPAIILLLVGTRLVATLAYFSFCRKCYPALRDRTSYDRTVLRALFAYGKWVTVSNVLEPLLSYADRFFIGSMLSVMLLAYYTAPYDAITRAWVIPSSLTATIFPAFSSLSAHQMTDRLQELCVRSLKSLLLCLGPVLFLVIFFAHDILAIWLGQDFARQSTFILQILAIGVLANSLAFVPLSLLHGLGRPDLPAKFHLIELPLYLFALTYCLSHMGIVGAAVAWTGRVLVDAVLQLSAVLRLKFISIGTLVVGGMLRSLVVVCAFGLFLAVPWVTRESAGIRTTLALIEILTFSFVAWNYAFDTRDRNLVIAATGQMRMLTKSK